MRRAVLWLSDFGTKQAIYMSSVYILVLKKNSSIVDASKFCAKHCLSWIWQWMNTRFVYQGSILRAPHHLYDSSLKLYVVVNAFLHFTVGAVRSLCVCQIDSLFSLLVIGTARSSVYAFGNGILWWYCAVLLLSQKVSLASVFTTLLTFGVAFDERRETIFRH